MGSEDWRASRELRDLEHELRDRVGDEFRREAEEGERLAAQGILRDRSLAGVALELLARGDTVAVGTVGKVFTGTVSHAATDLLTLTTTAGQVHVNLAAPLYLRVVERVREGGQGRPPGPQSFRARLLELELDRTEIELGTIVLGDLTHGRLRAVGRDHVVFVDRDGGEWFVPLNTLAYAARYT